MARTARPDTARRDLYQEITDTVLAALDEGTVPWHKPWTENPAAGLPTSLSTGRAYRGANVFLLYLAGMARGYTSTYWGTYKAIAERGGQVRKGEKGTTVVFWKRLQVATTAEERAQGRGDSKVIPMLRHYTVFNAEQADGLPERYLTAPERPEGFDPIEECEAIVAGYAAGPLVKEGGLDGAWYSPARDLVSMPDRGDFEGAEEFYSTLFHELGHSTGHASRLNRPGITEGHRFGSEMYGKEELVAEMTAAMLSAVAGIHQTTVPNSTAYLAGWIRTIKGEPKLIVQAAGLAQRAADRILGTTFEESADEE